MTTSPLSSPISSARTARLLSVAVLLLTLAPLGSLYVLLNTLRATPTLVIHESTTYRSPERWRTVQRYTSQTNAAESTILKDTMEFRTTESTLTTTTTTVSSAPASPMSSGTTNPLSPSPPSPDRRTADAISTRDVMAWKMEIIAMREATVRHLAFILPWFLSILLGVIIPAGLSVVSLLWTRQELYAAREPQALQQQQQQQQYYRQEKIYRRIQEYTVTLKDYHHHHHHQRTNDSVVRHDPIMEPNGDASSGFSSPEITFHHDERIMVERIIMVNDAEVAWRLPKPGISKVVEVSSSSLYLSQEDNSNVHENNRSSNVDHVVVVVDDDGEGNSDNMNGNNNNDNSNTSRHVRSTDDGWFASVTSDNISIRDPSSDNIHPNTNTDDHHNDDDGSNSITTVMNTGSSHLTRRPRATITTIPGNTASTTHRYVTQSCAICLQPYQMGETVTWSSNPNCIHCFHTDCIVPWLIRKTSGKQCPCCRQRFVAKTLDHT